MKTAIYPGSFDPVTRGHLSIIERAAKIFDKLIVCVMVNSEKSGMFTPDERIELIERVVSADYPNVEVDKSYKLLADYAVEKDSCVIVKGLRFVSDFEKEFQMALINKTINPSLETMFLTCEHNYMYLSSSVVKEMARYDVSLDEYVPVEIVKDIKERTKALIESGRGLE